MSTPADRLSPLDRYFLLQEAQVQTQSMSPIDSYFQQRQKKQSEGGLVTAIGDAVRFLEESPFLQQIERVGRRITDPLAIREIVQSAPGGKDAVRETLARESGLDLATLVGVLKGAALDPAQSVAQLAEAAFLPSAPTVTGAGSVRASEWLARAEQGLFNAAEKYALSSGVSESEVTAAYEIGNFIGFMAPVTASVKAAQLFTKGTAVSMMKWPWVGDLITDSVAGAIYGGLFVPETDMSNRVKNSLASSAEFGIGRVIASSFLPFKTYRTKRAYEKKVRRDVLEGRTLNPGAIIDEPASLASLLNEEQWVLSSPQAQRILTENANEDALVQAIIDVSGSQGSGGVLRQASADFKSAVGMQDRFRGQFPGLKFDAIKNKQGSFDVYFGTKGLSNKQRSQLKTEGRFDGLEIEYGDAVYDYVGRASRPEYIRLRNKVDGKVKEVKEENITDRFTFTEAVERTPRFDALYQDFSRYYDEGADAVLTARGGMTEGQWIQSVARGEASASPANRRAFDQAGAIVNPEELGPELAQAISQVGPTVTGTRGPLDPVSWFTFDDIVERWAAERGIPIDASDFPAIRQHFATRKRTELWESVPAADKQIYADILQKQDELVDRFGISLEQWAGGKGFQAQKLPSGQVVLREVNTGAPFAFGSEASARDWLKAVVRPEKGLPSDLPDMQLGIQAATNRGSRAYDVWTFDELVGSLEGSQHLPALNGIRPLREAFLAIEDAGSPRVWSNGFLPVDAGMQRLRQQYAPWAKEIESAWKGINHDRKLAISEVWREIEGTEISLPEAVRLFKARGFNSKEISAFTKSHQILDRGFDISGIDGKRYMNMYYSRVLPVQGNLKDDGLSAMFSSPTARPAETEFFAEFTRTGQLPLIERDPEMILHKYFRSLLWSKEVKPAYDRFSMLVGQRGSDGAIKAITFRDMEKMWGKEAADAALSRARPGTSKDSPVIPGPLRDFVSEYLNNVRGVPDKSWETLRNFSDRMFKDLNIKTNPRYVEEALNTWMGTMYGAAIGLRPALIARNMTQNLWMLYTRIGNRQIGPGLEMALSKEGFAEVARLGVSRVHDGGLPLHDAIFRNLSSEEVSGPLGRMFRSITQKYNRLNQTSLTLYSTSDQLNRSWAYFSQKLHTADALLKYERGRIGWDRFIEDGLPFFKKPIKDQFRRIYDKEGKEKALQFIGFQASDEANFIYGMGGSPAWMQKPWGRMVGMFGQWPLWASELYLSRFRTGTPKQKAAFVARTAALAGIFANMAYETGTNMWSWIAPNSMFTWGGGPAVDFLMNATTLLEAPWAEKPGAFGRLFSNIGRLAVPGQVAWNEASDVLDSNSPDQAIFRLYLGRPSDNLDWVGNWEVDPRTLQDEAARGYVPAVTPETRAALQATEYVPLGLSNPREQADRAALFSQVFGPQSNNKVAFRDVVPVDDLLKLLPRPGVPRE